MSLVAALFIRRSKMVDEVTLEVSQSNTENTSSTLSNQIGWVTFDEPDSKESTCNNCIAEEKVSGRNGQYISRLGEFKILGPQTLPWHGLDALMPFLVRKKADSIRPLSQYM